MKSDISSLLIFKTGVLNDYLNIKKTNIHQITTGGSSRKYFRISSENKSYIYCEYSDIAELKRFLDITGILDSSGINVPKIYYSDLTAKFILLQDLGKEAVYDKIKSNKIDIINLYKRILDELFLMQTKCGKILIENYPERKFDSSVYKWETEYFRTMVLDKYLLADYDRLELTNCFNYIAEYLGETESELLKPEKKRDKNVFFIHRDFQSQNILHSENKIYFIDYQTAYCGSNFYDLASLLYDPYSENEIKIYFNELFNYYKNKFIDKFDMFDSEEFDKRFALTSIQRLMQANAAYVKLGLIENKIFFKQFVDSTLKKIYNILMKTDCCGAGAGCGADYLKKLFSKLEKEGKIKCAE